MDVMTVVDYAWDAILALLAIALMMSVFFVKPSHFASKRPSADAPRDET